MPPAEAEAEVRRQLRVRQSRLVLGGQQTPDPVTERPAWSSKATNGPDFPFFSGPVLNDHWVGFKSNEGKKIFPPREVAAVESVNELDVHGLFSGCEEDAGTGRAGQERRPPHTNSRLFAQPRTRTFTSLKSLVGSIARPFRLAVRLHF